MRFRTPATLVAIALLASALVAGGTEPLGLGSASTAEAAAAATTCGNHPAGTPVSSSLLTSYTAITPRRLLDTRNGHGGIDAAVPAGCTVQLKLGSEVPVGVQAVALSLTAVSDAVDYMTVYPCALGRPGTSNLNYRPGATANLVVAIPDANRRICIYTHATAHVIVDLSGWWGSGANRFASIAPVRAYDSRTPGRTPLEPFQPRAIEIPASAVPENAVSAVINLTSTRSDEAGYFTAYPCGGTAPNASNLNFHAGEDRAVAAIVGLAAGRQICVLSSVRSDVIVDVNGYYAPAPQFGPTASLRTSSGVRLVDTRNGIGGPRRPFAPFEVRAYRPADVLPGGGQASAVVLNVVTDSALDAGYVTMFPCQPNVPNVSSLNYRPPWVTSNLAVVELGPDGTVCVQTSTTTDVIIDVYGVAAAPTGSLVERLGSDHQVFPPFHPAATDYAVKCRAASQDVVFDVSLLPGTTGTTQHGGTLVDGRNVRRMTTDQLMSMTLTRGGQTRTYHFRCLPTDFPDLAVSRPSTPSPGWYLTTFGALGSPSGAFAVIFDEYGAPVWYKRTEAALIDLKRLSDGSLTAAPGGDPFGVRPNVSFWNFTTAGATLGKFQLSNPATMPLDVHDLVEVPGGRTLLSYPTVDDAAAPLLADLTSLNPPRDVTARPSDPDYGPYTATTPFADGVIEERTGAGDWRWRMSDHVPPEEATFAIRFPFLSPAVDVYHINSVDLVDGGDYVLSARHLDAAIRVNRHADADHAEGEVEWVLGGNHASAAQLCGAGSALRTPTNKCLQIVGDPWGGPKRPHDARLDGDILTLFDNQAAMPGRASRAVAYRIDPTAMTATMIWEIRQPTGQNGDTLGSVRTAADGAVLVGWGAPIQPMIQEFAVDGSVQLSISQAPSGFSYRVVKEPKSAFSAAMLRSQAGGGTIARPA